MLNASLNKTFLSFYTSKELKIKLFFLPEIGMEFHLSWFINVIQFQGLLYGMNVIFICNQYLENQRPVNP